MAPNRRTETAAGRRQRVRVVRATTLGDRRSREPEPAPPEQAAPEPAPPEQAAPEPAAPEPATESASTSDGIGSRPGRRRLIPLLLAVAVLCAAFAGYAGVRWRQLRSDTSTNAALTDNAATSAVTGQITSAINTIFSYDYTDLAKTQRAASGLLTGPAACQYDKLFATVREQAPKQKLVVTVTVTSTGVELLDGDRARLLVFATQSSTSAVSKQTSAAGAMFAIDARREGRVWRISGIDTFTGPVAGC